MLELYCFCLKKYWSEINCFQAKGGVAEATGNVKGAAKEVKGNVKGAANEVPEKTKAAAGEGKNVLSNLAVSLFSPPYFWSAIVVPSERK